MERSPKTAFKSAFPEEEDGEEDEEDEEMDEDESEDDETFDEDPELPSDLSDDSDDEMDGLESFVDELTNADKKRKAGDDDTAATGKKRRVLPVMSAPGLSDGSELALKSKSKVDLSSLIASAPGLDAKALLPTKAEAKSTSVLKGGVLAAPLPTVVQERLDREAAYEKTKDEGQKWSGAMKRIKEAEHLNFPLQASARGGVKSAGELVATFKAGNAHESAVEALLASANLTDKGVAAAEDAALRGQDLTVEEIAARRAELRHQRELMFRAESRAKRVAKIKSKTFRKLARKREAKGAPGEIDLEDLERLDPEAAAEERERLERERARERATLRHGAKTGRWAQNLDDREADEDQRMAKLAMLDMKEKLQRKIHAAGSGSESEASSDEDDEDEEAIKARAFEQLDKLETGAAAPLKGIAGMKFMQKAAEREMKKVREAEAALRAELDGEEAADSDDEGPEMMRLGEGRMVFSGPTPGGEATKDAKATPAAAAAAAPARSPSPEPVLFGAANPWLAEGGSALSRKRNAVATSAEAKAVRALKKAGKDRAVAADDEVVEISLDVAPKLKKEEQQLKSILKKRDVPKAEVKKVAKEDSGSDSDSDGDDELLPISGVKAFTQRELVAEAFAGDNVVEVSSQLCFLN
jgi:U3 small nucleolar RNA-associated protein 14